jgi:hypothetical protein
MAIMSCDLDHYKEKLVICTMKLVVRRRKLVRLIYGAVRE